jgi:hypothetical protein
VYSYARKLNSSLDLPDERFSLPAKQTIQRACMQNGSDCAISKKWQNFARRYQDRVSTSITNALSDSPQRENGTRSLWDQHRELLVAKRIPQQAPRWYLTHLSGSWARGSQTH